MLLPTVLLYGLVAAFVVSRGGAVDESELRRILPYFIAANHAIVFLVLLRVLRSEGRTLGDLGWRLPGGVPGASRELLVGIAAGFTLYLFKELALDSVRALLAGNAPTFTTLFRFHPPEEELSWMIVGSTFVLVEESVYRGYGLAALLDRWRPAPALLAMAVLFGILHTGNGPLAVVFTAVIGTGLAAVFLWRRTLIAPFVAHALYNVLVVLT